MQYFTNYAKNINYTILFIYDEFELENVNNIKFVFDSTIEVLAIAICGQDAPYA